MDIRTCTIFAHMRFVKYIHTNYVHVGCMIKRRWKSCCLNDQCWGFSLFPFLQSLCCDILESVCFDIWRTPVGACSAGGQLVLGLTFCADSQPRRRSPTRRPSSAWWRRDSASCRWWPCSGRRNCWSTPWVQRAVDCTASGKLASSLGVERSDEHPRTSRISAGDPAEGLFSAQGGNSRRRYRFFRMVVRGWPHETCLSALDPSAQRSRSTGCSCFFTTFEPIKASYE